ncbi:hypothetical protein CAXC1_330128 [Candidatus Xenohaliotis californiensis]|uniref:Uncharacterized protein n=1 Tax=Candidatus Xenohaliotis californiensis TaxID=84677 RepID=A0ABP0ETR2_9RICK|nr:hypothetical protein CAXC1_330128 [Candidatus Xenohaliotis californiensis]
MGNSKPYETTNIKSTLGAGSIFNVDGHNTCKPIFTAAKCTGVFVILPPLPAGLGCFVYTHSKWMLGIETNDSRIGTANSDVPIKIILYTITVQ